MKNRHIAKKFVLCLLTAAFILPGPARVPAESLPSKYNLYEKGKLPSVRKQDPYQSCWAFAVIGAMESDLIADGKKKKDLSEAHLAYYVTNKYKDPKGCRKDTVSKNG